MFAELLPIALAVLGLGAIANGVALAGLYRAIRELRVSNRKLRLSIDGAESAIVAKAAAEAVNRMGRARL